ncbi:class I SAM-dependent methyltransferase [Pleionea sediminis]|uniref:class I SAM-dependent methyltransferase n=1 Tax=Pleionea sediminis TaxID=2569479 RepID=UPI0011866445|nr:class I SAM-dependent methyltransferase [Pleionea sediminis]
MAFSQLYTTSLELANEFQPYGKIQLVDDVSLSDENWFLVKKDDCLSLNGLLLNDFFSLSFNFLSGNLKYRTQHGGGRKEPLAKAIGLKNNATPTVIDATAGMGREAFLLASMGCQVTAYERNPIIYFLLKDAVRRLENNGDFQIKKVSLQVKHCNSIDTLGNLTVPLKPDVVYLDPMFPERTKSAAVKKEMRIFKQLAGNDEDDAQLLKASLGAALKRVVVKRPGQAPFINNMKPDHQILSKKHRFDVYVTAK